uniref:Uncharacterized protein n=1 Tax=Sphaerodactylus townsendi TaxID=933632 RepID=A0ACB8G7X7_9SAUR
MRSSVGEMFYFLPQNVLKCLCGKGLCVQPGWPVRPLGALSAFLLPFPFLLFQTEKETPAKPSADPPRSKAKKPPEAPAKPSSAQVSALMARLPLLLPRMKPMEGLVVSSGVAAVHPSPTVLAPKLTATPVGGTVKMALSVGPTSSQLPLAPAVNGPGGLVSQQSTVPVINMILPGVAVPPVAKIPAKPKSLPAGEGPASGEPQRSLPDPQKAKAPCKRPADSSTDVATVKRKRGRPRKKPDEPESDLSDKATAEEEASDANEDPDIIVVTVGYEDHKPSPSTPRGSQEKVSEVDVLCVGDGKQPSPTDTSGADPPVASSHIVGNPIKTATLPSQVSVIQGHKSGAQSEPKEAGSDSQKPRQLGESPSEPGGKTKSTLARDSVSLPLLEESGSSSESEPEPQDLSLSKSNLPPSKEHSDTTSSRASVMCLCRNSAERNKGDAANTPVTSTHSPSP